MGDLMFDHGPVAGPQALASKMRLAHAVGADSLEVSIPNGNLVGLARIIERGSADPEPARVMPVEVDRMPATFDLILWGLVCANLAVLLLQPFVWAVLRWLA